MLTYCSHNLLYFFKANDVKNMQEVLQRTFVQLDFATNPEEESFYRNQIKELKQKSEEMIVILKVTFRKAINWDGLPISRNVNRYNVMMMLNYIK